MSVFITRKIMTIKLINEACETALKNIPDGSIDAIINDPPFGVTQCKWDDALDMKVMWPEYIRVLKPTGIIVLFSSQPFTSKLIVSNEDMFKYCWHWEKEQGTNFLNALFQPLRVMEEICVFSPASGKKTTYNPRKTMRDKIASIALPKTSSDIQGTFASQNQEEKTYIEYTDRQPKNILRFPRDRTNFIPTQKPVALLEYIVETYTNDGDTVLDPTMGSGTCGVACKKLDRKFIGIEVDPDHFEIARKRIESVPSTEFFKQEYR
jgi:site-specific DNA-methyltransferase (adenine-specific)